MFTISTENKSGIQVLKQIDMKQVDNSMIGYVLKEAELLRKLKHRNIIGYEHSYFDKKDKMFYLILEYAPAGDLEGLFKK